MVRSFNIATLNITGVMVCLDTNIFLLVNQFLQTKLHCGAQNKSYLHIGGMYKSNNKQLRYQVNSNCKIFIC